MNSDSGIKIILLLFVIFLFLLFRPVLHKYDPVGYYSWVRTVVIDKDLNILNEFDHFDMSKFASAREGSYPAHPWAVGCAILWLPFFLLAHVGVLLANYCGYAFPANGYSLPYVFVVALGTSFYSLVGLIIIHKLLRQYYSDFIATTSIVVIWLASPLVFYMYSHPLMSHAFDMFCYSLLLWAWQRVRIKGNLTDYIFLGGVAGLDSLVRTQNVGLALLIIFFIILSIVRQKFSLILGFCQLLIFGLTWLVTFLPQLYVWHCIFGSFFPGNPYSLVDMGTFHSGFPWIMCVMFSDDRGLFVWHPIILLGVAGWYFLRKKDSELTYFLLFSFIFQLAVIGSWSYWNGSSSFGQRFFVNLAPAFMFGLAALLHGLPEKISPKVILSICGLFIVWNLLLIIQYSIGTAPRTGPTNFWTLLKNQFIVFPKYWRRIVEAWLTRA